jgi:anti-anti-sigma regulatory factor
MRQTLVLPVELTIYTASATRADWLAWLGSPDLDRKSTIRIDAAPVEDVDGAGVQLFGALLRSLLEQAVAWQVVAPSAALLEACRALGCPEWLTDSAQAVPSP